MTVAKTASDNNGDHEYKIIDLSSPILITMPISLVDCNATEFNCTGTNNNHFIIKIIYTNSLNKVECKFYNNTIEDWDTRGCYVASLTNTQVTCACNHLTDFLASLRVGLRSLENTGYIIEKK